MLKISDSKRAGRRHRIFRRGLVPGLGLSVLVSTTANAQYFSLGKPLYPLEFYDVDFTNLTDSSLRSGILDTLHYIPVGFGSDSYLSLGGELREQYWSQSDESHALRTPFENSYDLQRVVADAYLHFDSRFAVFAQVARDDAFDKIGPSTTDETRGRVQQGFLGVKEPVGQDEFDARLGRQEITLGSGRFVWINDSSNVRTTHDGARVHADFGDGATLDLVATRPVIPTYTAFADWFSHSGSFGAVYASEPFFEKQLHLDEYYFYRRSPGVQFATQTGNEDRDTVGGRIWGAVGGFKYDSDFAYQWGKFDTATESKTISAVGHIYTNNLYFGGRILAAGRAVPDELLQWKRRAPEQNHRNVQCSVPASDVA